MRRKRKENYSREEVVHLHNRYRVVIFGLLAIFFWILYHYGVADEFLYDASGGQLNVKKGMSFWGIVLMVAKWLFGVVSIGMGLFMFYAQIIKKKKG